MKRFTILLILTGLLSGCWHKTPVEQSFDDVHQAVVAVKDSLPAECKTEIILTKINNIESKNQVAQSVCEKQIKDIEIKYERALLALILVISVFFLRFFIKI